jgi:peptide/nickel transport system substrate-binding protein
MLVYIVKRLLLMIPVLLGVAFIVFFIMNLTPGDQATFTADPQVDRLVEQGRTSVDAAVREQAYQELAIYLADLTNNANIVYTEINAGGNNKVENFILDPIGYHKLDNVQVRR